jgi:hypothetical protein
VKADGVGPGLGEPWGVFQGVLDHEVGFHRKVRMGPYRLHDQGPDRDVGDEVAVHNVEVKEIGAGLLRPADLFSETGEVGGKKGRCDQDTIPPGDDFFERG